MPASSQAEWLDSLIEFLFMRRMPSLQQGLSVSQVERTILCPPSDYQTHLCSLVMQGLQDTGKKSQPQVRSLTNSVMELRNISNHPFLVRSQKYPAFLCGALSAQTQLKPSFTAYLMRAANIMLCIEVDIYICQWQQDLGSLIMRGILTDGT